MMKALRKGACRVCGRFYTEMDQAEMRSIIDAVNRRLMEMGIEETAHAGEIFPSDIAPVYISERGKATPVPMRWGFKGFKGSQLIINARSETAEQKPLFREALWTGRCLVPASWYFEWEKRGKERVKHAIQTEKPLLYMAALFRSEPGAALPAFTIVTKEAAADVRRIHDRMPVILCRDARRAWMGGAPLGETVKMATEEMLVATAD